MVRKIDTNERELYGWLSKEELDNERETYIKDNKGQFLTFLQSNKEHFAEFNNTLKNVGAELTTRFFSVFIWLTEDLGSNILFMN